MSDRRYAVVWDHRADVSAGGLVFVPGGFALDAREPVITIRFADIREAAIRRAHVDRLRGLPVLALHLPDEALLRIASLEGIGALHELTDLVRSAVRHLAE